MFDPTHSLWHRVVRGAIVYVVLLALLRIVNDRQVGDLNVSDSLLAFVGRLIDARPKQIIRDGRRLVDGLRSETLTAPDLQAQLRLGACTLWTSAPAFVEANG